MQHGSLIKSNRKRGPDVWQFRWAERGPQGKRIYRKRVIGTVCQYSDADSARKAVTGLLAEINSNDLPRGPLPMTVAEVCDHFDQRELTKDNTWRSYSTKTTYKAYLKRWIIPQWGALDLSRVRTIEVESWLRRLPLAKSSCAKIRGFAVGAIQSCLPLRTVRPQSHSSGSSGGKTESRAECPYAH